MRKIDSSTAWTISRAAPLALQISMAFSRALADVGLSSMEIRMCWYMACLMDGSNISLFARHTITA